MEVSKEGELDARKDTDADKAIPLHSRFTAPLVAKFNRPFFLFVLDWMTQRALLTGNVFNPAAEWRWGQAPRSWNPVASE
ncbi:Hypothetical predicted protein [Lynx pardinus]|uniref:Uncharacterized protein n=1 Tax=Lynx pardinus TaxID=191816 RepID=A0A485MBJ9_LYNPA|nr:Hypothetical predicted protein [Lynx pardinus]